MVVAALTMAGYTAYTCSAVAVRLADRGINSPGKFVNLAWSAIWWHPWWSAGVLTLTAGLTVVEAWFVWRIWRRLCQKKLDRTRGFPVDPASRFSK